jgi:hypothetical protein
MNLPSFPVHDPPVAYLGAASELAFAASQTQWVRSLEQSDAFWEEQAKAKLSWFSPFSRVSGGGFANGDVHWFAEGKLNACYNCVDRHLPHRADQVLHDTTSTHDLTRRNRLRFSGRATSPARSARSRTASCRRK